MKRILFLISLGLASFTVIGQAITDTGSEVGIGISIPTSTLHIYKPSSLDINFESNLDNAVRLYLTGANQQWSLRKLNNNSFSIVDDTDGGKMPFRIEPGAGGDAFRIKSNGFIGIGSDEPKGKLDIHKGEAVFSTPNQAIGNGSNLFGLTWYVDDNSGGRISEAAAAIRLLGTGTWNATASPSLLSFETIGSAGGGTMQRMIINHKGNVGIGTPETGTHRLAVEGTIGAREIKVEAGTWSDFVFDEDYKLRSLEETEAFITENHHLPEIPSEAEVTENGIYLGDMNAKLLMKVEELTLYMIDMNKRMNELQETNEAMKAEIKALKEN